MGTLTDFYWSKLRALAGQKPTIQGPPPSDPLSKAARYLAQPPYHYSHHQALSPEDHWLLTAADIVATGLLRTIYAPQNAAERMDLLAASPTPHVEPWYQPSLQALSEQGWQPGTPQEPAIPGLSPDSTHLQVTQQISRGFPDWMEGIRQDFPQTYLSTLYFPMLFDGGEDVFTWLNNGENTITPQLDPIETALGRLFEQQLFPTIEIPPDALGQWLDRANQIAMAIGRQQPGRLELQRAADEIGIILGP